MFGYTTIHLAEQSDWSLYFVITEVDDLIVVSAFAVFDN